MYAIHWYIWICMYVELNKFKLILYHSEHSNILPITQCDKREKAEVPICKICGSRIGSVLVFVDD
jgi:hypothetical protein